MPGRRQGSKGRQPAADLHADYLQLRRQYRLAAIAVLAVIAGGMVFYHFVEHFSWLNAVYFCVITLTTIGYGDIVPTTPAGKLFTIFYVFVGIGIIGFFANLLVRHAVMRREFRRSQKQQR